MNEFNLFKEFPELQSDELILCNITVSDLNDLFDLVSNETLYKYSSSHAKKTKAAVYNMIAQFERDFNQKKAIYWGIHQKSTFPKLIGLIEIFDFNKSLNMVTIGYMINEDYWGNGYASKSVQLVLKFIFSLGEINSVQALVVSENTKSIRVLMRNNFTYDGSIPKKFRPSNNVALNVDIYSIQKKDFSYN